MRPRRLAATLAAALFALLVLSFSLLIAVLGTGWGTRWSLRLAQHFVPELHFEQVAGDWLRGLQIGTLRWSDAHTRLEITDLHTGLRWIELLLDSQVQLRPLSAARLELQLTPGPDDGKPVQLPLLWVPVPLQADRFELKQLVIAQPGSRVEIDNIRAGVHWLGTTLSLSRAALDYAQNHIEADAELKFRGDYPLILKGTLRNPQLPGKLAVQTAGDLRQLLVHATLDGPWPLRGDGRVALLDSNLPLSADIHLAKPTTWTGGGENVQLQRVDLTLRGNLEGLQGDLAANLQEQRYGASRVQATWQWQPGQLQIAPTIALPQGGASGDCRLTLDTPLSWQCRGQLSQVPLTPWLAKMTGDVTGPFELQGGLDHSVLQLTVHLPDFQGHLDDREVTGKLQLVTADGSLWLLQQAELQSGPNHVAVEGEIGTRNALRAELRAGDLSLLYAPLAGSATVSATLAGNWSAPDLKGRFQAQKLQYRNIGADSAEGDFTLQRLGLDASRLQLETRGLHVAGQPPITATLHASGTRAVQQLALDASQPGRDAALRCDGRLDKDFSDWQLTCPELRGNLRGKRSKLAWQQRARLHIRWQIAATAVEVAPFCLGADSAELCLDQVLRYRDGRLQAVVAHGANVPLAWLRPYLPPGLQLENEARAEARLTLESLSPFKLNGSAKIPESRWQWFAENKTQAATLQDMEITAQLDESRAELTAKVQSPTLGRFSTRLTVLDPRGKRELNGDIDVQALQLAGFAWMVRGLDTLTGQVDGHVHIDGSASALRMQGLLELDNGTVGWPPLGDLVKNIRLTGRFDNNSADFKGSFALGTGKGDLGGSLRWQEGGDLWDLRMKVDAHEITITPLPDSEVALSPHVELRITPFRFVTNGEVDIDHADIQVKELPPDTIKVSPDEEIVGREQPASTWQLLTDVNLNLGKQFHFRGFGADVNLSGNLHLQRDNSQLFRAYGQVKVDKGRYRAYGQRLTVRSGSFIFTGPWDNPDLNLQAVRELPPGTTSDVVVGIKVSGPLRSPNAQLFSEPGMPESDIAYYLLTGHARASTQTTQYSAGGTLLALGLAGSGDQAERLAKQFGIGDFQIGTVEGSNGAEAEMSGYVTPDLYVRYGRGLLQRSNSVTFQYRLTPQLIIETVSGIEDALDVLYSFTWH